MRGARYGSGAGESAGRAGPGIDVDHLTLQLPEPLRLHAATIGHLTAKALAALPVLRDARVASLSIPNVVVSPGASPQAVASAIATAVAASLEGRED